MYLIRTFETNNKHLLSLNIKRRKMKITQIRENGDTEALSVTDIDLLIEKMKKETKLRPVTGLRQALHFVLPDEPCSLANKLPRVIPAAAFERVNGVKRMKTYNGIVELTIGPLAGKTEVEIVKQKAAELPQTMLAFMGASGKSVKIWTCFTRPDGTLPQWQGLRPGKGRRGGGFRPSKGIRGNKKQGKRRFARHGRGRRGMRAARKG